MTHQEYVGKELTLFARAVRWKNYFAGTLRRFIGKRVLEVGAGLGATTPALCDGAQAEWLCLEPDASLRSEIEALIRAGKLPACCATAGGFLADLPAERRFDTILYIDVLEHIQDDAGELQAAARHLAPGGAIIVLSPAHQFLYSPFDREIGHYRRYDKPMLRALTPTGCQVARLLYLDSVGMTTSLVNRLFLRQSLPTEKQILFWDRYLIPASRVADRLCAFQFGRSIVAVWTKRA